MTMGFFETRRTRLSNGWRENVCLLLFISILVTVTAIPYIFAYVTAPPNKQFMGLLLDVPDGAQYLSWAREFERSILIENKLTPEQGAPVFVNVFFLMVGRLARFLHLGVAEALQVVRVGVGGLYLGAIWWWVRLTTRDRWERWLSFLVITVGGGVGWIFVVAKQVTGTLASPLDIYVTEPNTFLTLMAFPHQAMAGALLVAVFGLTALALERESFGFAALAGLLALALGFQHGYDLLLVYAVLGSATLVWAVRGPHRLRPFILFGTVGVISAPAAVYLLLLTHLSPIWQGVLAQYGNAGVYTPAPFHLLIVMGAPLMTILSVKPSLASRLGSLRPREIILRSWLLVGCLLLYIPTNFQIKMLGGWQIPVGIIACRLVVRELVPTLKNSRWLRSVAPVAALSALLICAVLPANLYLYAWRFVDLNRHDYPYYLSGDEVKAMTWIGDHSSPSDVVLSSLTTGQYLPSESGNHAFLAHWAQTLDFYAKSHDVADFYTQATDDSKRKAILSRFEVRYVLFSAPERSLGSFDPDKARYLERVFTTTQASVYEVHGMRCQP